MVAGFGNVLRGDDGFGVAVAELLARGPLPPEVRVTEVGIGGIHLVQDLMVRPADLLVVIDAVDVGRPPGSVVVLEPPVDDVAGMTVNERRDALADMHYATPDRALLLATALEVRPVAVVIVGCQPVDAEAWEQGLSGAVETAVPVAAAEIRRVVTGYGVAWPEPTGGSEGDDRE